MNQRRLRDWSGEVRDQSDIVRFTQCRNLHELRNAAHVRHRGAAVVDEMRFQQSIDVPAISELLAHGDGHLDLPAQLAVDLGIL